MTEGDGTTRPQLTIDLVIKLGGAAITEKSNLETLRPDALRQGAQLIKRCCEARKKVVVVHGAGSFGHHHAKQYKLNEGFECDPDHIGFCLTRESVTKLNRFVVESLTSVELPAVSCPPFPAWKTAKRKVSSWPREAIGEVLESNFIPVFHGDCVLDAEQGCSILSGDTIIQTLCENFKVKKVIFLTDVHGVYDKPPDQKGATLIHRLQFSNTVDVNSHVKTSISSHDVTGGIQSKLESAMRVASTQQTRVFVAKIGSDDAATLCLDEEINIENLQATEVIAS